MSTTNQDNTVEYVKNPPDPKTASAWIEKDTYTRDEVREISEARRIAGIWDVIGDPELDINTVVKKSLEYWVNDTSISEDEKEKLARKYGEVLYDWSRFECDCSNFEPKSISETQSYMQTLLERNQEYIDGKRLKGVN